ASSFLHLRHRRDSTLFPYTTLFRSHMIAQQCDLGVGDFVHTFGDTHLYSNHLTDDIVFEQLRRKPKALPTLVIKRKPASIFDYEFEDFEFVDYDPQGVIRAPIAI